MVALAPGTNGTLKSTSYEAALLEAAQLLELAEEGSVTPTTVNFTDVSLNNAAKTADITINLPVTLALSTTDGSIAITGDSYVTPTFANGGGDIKSTTLPAAVLELAQYLQALEVSTSGAPNNVNIVFNTEQKYAAITASLPAVKSIGSDGKIRVTVTPYL
ncbi:hypothetical protein [Nostoc sp. PA-18-2419]|uniref:hypothetical protein n=1 Tax=Nostoc sp. PA-18-2419 TaxID=2575443 RepID=UPI0011081A06|nr:hypothetical protein [Nostoc sp. PA-18-2419]